MTARGDRQLATERFGRQRKWRTERPCGSIWVFLARGRFAAKSLALTYWNLLDFLGFSRPNRDISMGYAGFSREKIFAPFCPWAGPERGDAAVEIMRMRRIIHDGSLA
jgi:hypothetical protein